MDSYLNHVKEIYLAGDLASLAVPYCHYRLSMHSSRWANLGGSVAGEGEVSIKDLGGFFGKEAKEASLFLVIFPRLGSNPLQGRIVAVHTPWMKYLQDGRRIDSNPYEHEKRVSFSVPQALELVDV